MGASWQRLSAVAGMALLMAAAAVGQQQGRDRDRTYEASRRIADDLRKARLRYGPFYLLSSIQLADIGYDQQYFLPTTDQSSGFTFGLSAPQRLYYTPHKKTYFSVDVDPRWSYFRSKGATNQFGYRTRADAQFLLNHLYLDAYGSRNNELRADTGELSALVTRRSQEAGVNGEMKYSSRTSMTYSAVVRGLSYPSGRYQPDLPVNLLDRSEHAYRLALLHKTFPLTSLLLASEYANYSFPNAVFKNSRRRYAGAGFIYDGGRTFGRFESGYMRLDFLRPGEHDFRGVMGNASISHQLSGIWTASVAADRDFAFSIFLGNNYYIANRATVSTEYSLTRRFSLNAGSTFVQDDYDVATAGAIQGIAKRRDKMNFTSIGWTYNWRSFRGGFDVGYLRRSSNFPIAKANGIRLVLRLSFTP